MRIIAISGSLRKDSFNSMLVRAFASVAPQGMEVEAVSLADVPFYNQDEEAQMPEAAKKLKQAIEGADGVILVTPEYNRSMPGVLKNAIDWASRPYGKNSFKGKPVLTAGVSIGKIGTAVAQSHLKQVLVYLEANLLGHPELYLGPAGELFDEAGNISNDSTKTMLAGALSTLAARIQGA